MHIQIYYPKADADRLHLHMATSGRRLIQRKLGGLNDNHRVRKICKTNK